MVHLGMLNCVSSNQWLKKIPLLIFYVTNGSMTRGAFSRFLNLDQD